MIRLTQHRNKIAIVVYYIQEDPTPGTWGSHQLLLEEYKRLDEDWQFWVNGMRMPSPNIKFRQLAFNTEFLEKMQRKHGELHCEYCGKPHLKIYHWTEKQGKDVATADHFLPKSEYPDLAFKESNLKVACKKCNEKKGKKTVPPEALKFPYPEKLVKKRFRVPHLQALSSLSFSPVSMKRRTFH
jgi:hypothetical protein